MKNTGSKKIVIAGLLSILVHESIDAKKLTGPQVNMLSIYMEASPASTVRMMMSCSAAKKARDLTDPAKKKVAADTKAVISDAKTMDTLSDLVAQLTIKDKDSVEAEKKFVQEQIKNISNAYVLKDNILVGARGVIPLYLFGFLEERRKQ